MKMEVIMFKRTLCMILVLVLALGMIPFTAGAEGLAQSYLNVPQRYSRGYDYEYNNTMNSSNPFGVDEGYVEGDVGDYDDPYDWYSFTLTDYGRVIMVAGAGTPTATTKFCLLNSSGNLIKTASFDYKETHPTQSNGDNADNYYFMTADLAPGTYYVRVSETNGSWITTYYFETLLVPATSISVTNVAETGKNKITWNYLSYADQYKVLRSTSKNGSYTTLTTTTGTSYTDTSAVAGTTYYYKVQAVSYSSSYLTSYSNVVSRTCDLPRPTGIKATRSASTGKVTVSWNKVTGADKYSVYYSTDGGSTYSLLKTITGTSLTHSSAPLGKTVYYKIVAVDADKSGANSAKSTWVKGTAVCARPEIKVSNVASTGKIKISWNAVDGAVKWGKVTGASKYTLYIYDANGTLLKTSTTTGTSITHSSAVAGKTYTYKVKAIGATSASNSAVSAAKDRTCDLARPTVTVSLNTSGKPVVSWGKVSGAVKYKIYIYNANGTLLKTSTTTGTKLTHSSAVRGATYTYKVVAMASVSAANSAYSTAKTITSR